MNSDLVKAVNLALEGKWQSAHEIVQRCESDTAAWIHAVVHKMEGDQNNSRYWYNRAGRIEHFQDDPGPELETIKEQLLREKVQD